jgi:hypothetical protein
MEEVLARGLAVEHGQSMQLLAFASDPNVRNFTLGVAEQVCGAQPAYPLGLNDGGLDLSGASGTGLIVSYRFHTAPLSPKGVQPVGV